jgi:glutaminyl-tRNA synthetase
VRAHHIPGSVGANPPDVTVSGVIQWVSAPHAVPAEVRLYDRLFTVPRPEDGDGELADTLNPESLQDVSGAMLEPSLARAGPGTRWQLERVGYLVVDAEDARPGALVLNRIVGLRDSWQGGAEAAPPAAPGEEGRQRSAKARTRPPKRTRAEYRAEARVRDPALADRFATWPATYGISEADADLLTGDRATGDLFADALAGGAPPAAVARWIVNELPPALGDRELAEAPITGAGVGALVTAVESGEITAAAAKEVFSEMAERGGDPREIVIRRGLAQVSDEGAIGAIVDAVIAGNPDKVTAYRGGKTALFGFLVGQVVRASQGKANPQVIHKVLAERLG